MPRKSQSSPLPSPPGPSPLSRGVPLAAYMEQISPGSANKSIGQLRREAVEKSGIVQGAQ
jgi:hypothetical protein